jgi:nucleoredoxin
MLCCLFLLFWWVACRNFTPLLQKFYHHVKKQRKYDFEIIFCSMDHWKNEYEAYCATMPWYCLPYNTIGRHIVSNLAQQYMVSGIPTVVVMDEDGTVLVPDAVSTIMTHDPSGTCFPWRPIPLMKVLPSTFIVHGTNNHLSINNNNNNSIHRQVIVNTSDIDHKYILLYFAASWCIPCQKFTSRLIEFYHSLTQARPNDCEVRTVLAKK